MLRILKEPTGDGFFLIELLSCKLSLSVGRDKLPTREGDAKLRAGEGEFARSSNAFAAGEKRGFRCDAVTAGGERIEAALRRRFGEGGDMQTDGMTSRPERVSDFAVSLIGRRTGERGAAGSGAGWQSRLRERLVVRSVGVNSGDAAFFCGDTIMPNAWRRSASMSWSGGMREVSRPVLSPSCCASRAVALTVPLGGSAGSEPSSRSIRRLIDEFQ